MAPCLANRRKIWPNRAAGDKKRADENAGPKKVFRRGCLKGLSYMLRSAILCKCEKEK